MTSIEGRRRDDAPYGDRPPDLQHGDYWKVAGAISDEPGNLTGTVWRFYFDGYGVATLTKHTVREENDGSISIKPGDGSSNSIGISGGHGKYWHGYVYNGEFTEV